jgi:hypothetical protein
MRVVAASWLASNLDEIPPLNESDPPRQMKPARWQLVVWIPALASSKAATGCGAAALISGVRLPLPTIALACYLVAPHSLTEVTLPRRYPDSNVAL